MLRKLIKRIHLEKHSVHFIDPLTFFQHLYFSCFLMELLSLADDSELKGDMAPLCRQYVSRDRLIFSNPSSLIMKRIENCCFDYLSKNFFITAGRMIRANVNPSSSINKEFLLDLFEHVIQLTIPLVVPRPMIAYIPKPYKHPRPTFQYSLIRREMEMAETYQQCTMYHLK